MAAGETTKELVARLRRQHAQSTIDFLNWGLSPEEIAEQDKEDAEYFAARQAEFAAMDANRQGEEQLADERIYERMRRHDRAFG